MILFLLHWKLLKYWNMKRKAAQCNSQTILAAKTLQMFQFRNTVQVSKPKAFENGSSPSSQIWVYEMFRAWLMVEDLLHISAHILYRELL